MDFDTRLSQVNGRIRRDGYPVSLCILKNRLYLRATLPPAPGSQKTAPYQQRLSLSLPAIPESLPTAEKQAREIARALIDQSFDWSRWRPTATQPSLAIDWINKFRQDYFQRRAENPKTLTTWRTYQSILNRLDPYRPLTNEDLLALILSYPPDSRVRQRACQVTKMLAKIAAIDFDPRPYRGDYGPNQLTPRDLPTDQEIQAFGDDLIDRRPEWGQVYGLLAAYGLRPHEIYYQRWIAPPRLDLSPGGKTDSRLIFPYPPEWVDRWSLVRGRIPRLSGIDNSAIGNRVTVAFKRLGCPFTPYCLRHAWAVRTLRYKLDLSLAARQMGHSVAVHTKIYHHWIDANVQQEAWERSTENPPL